MTALRAALAASAQPIVVILDWLLIKIAGLDLPPEVETALIALLAGGSVAATMPAWLKRKEPTQ